MHTGCRTAFTTAVRVINRVHDHTTHRRADTAPTGCAGLTDRTQAVLFITDFADGGTAFDVHTTDFTGTQAQLSIDAFAGQ